MHLRNEEVFGKTAKDFWTPNVIYNIPLEEIYSYLQLPVFVYYSN
jgi:hypothetical protein